MRDLQVLGFIFVLSLSLNSFGQQQPSSGQEPSATYLAGLKDLVCRESWLAFLNSTTSSLVTKSTKNPSVAPDTGDVRGVVGAGEVETRFPELVKFDDYDGGWTGFESSSGSKLGNIAHYVLLNNSKVFYRMPIGGSQADGFFLVRTPGTPEQIELLIYSHLRGQAKKLILQFEDSPSATPVVYRLTGLPIEAGGFGRDGEPTSLSKRFYAQKRVPLNKFSVSLNVLETGRTLHIRGLGDFVGQDYAAVAKKTSFQNLMSMDKDLGYVQTISIQQKVSHAVDSN